MITVAVCILIVLFALGSISPLLLNDDTDSVVERRPYPADETADGSRHPAPCGAGTLAVSRPHRRTRTAARVRRSRRSATARDAWVSRRAG